MYFKHDDLYLEIPFREGDYYSDPFQLVIHKFGLSLNDRNHMLFLDLKGQPISWDSLIPAASDDFYPGFSRRLPILVKVFNFIYFRRGSVVKRVSTKGCKFFGDIVKRLRELFRLRASCDIHVIFTILSDPIKAIDLCTELPHASLHQADNPIDVDSMKVRILLANLDENGEPIGTFAPVTLFADEEVTRRGYGLRRALDSGEANDPEGDLLTTLDHLEPNQKYVRDLGADSIFDRWQRHESAAMELETALPIFKYAAEREINLTPLSRVIKDKRGKQTWQEWDAAFYDYANEELHLCEAKHCMTEAHVEDVKTKLEVLPNFIKLTRTAIYPTLKPKQTNAFLASGLFGDGVKELAAEYGYKLCYPSGDRYCVDTIRTAGSSVSAESFLAE